MKIVLRFHSSIVMQDLKLPVVCLDMLLLVRTHLQGQKAFDDLTFSGARLLVTAVG
jgi:hypothetical protein